MNQKLTSNLITSGYNMNVNDLEFNNDKQIEMFAFREARARKNIFDLYYQNLKGFVRVLFGKMLSNKRHPSTQELFDLIEEYGVDLAFLDGEKDEYGVPSSLKVSLSKANGTGSQFADQIMADKLLSVSGRLGPDEQDTLLKMYISANGTPEIAEELTASLFNDNNSLSKDKFDAVMAANNLEQGFPVPNSTDHDALIFSDTLIQRVNEIVKAWQEGQYGEQVVYVSPEFQHLEGIAKETQAEQAFDAILSLYSAASFHVSRMVNDPINETVGNRFKSILGELLNPLKQIEARAGQDAQARQSAIEQRLQNASEIKEENEVKRQEVLAKIQRENLQTQAKIQQRNQMDSFNRVLKQRKLEDDRAFRAAELAKDRELEALDVSQKNAFESLRRRQEINNG